MNTFYRRISLILAVIFLLDLILAPLASFAESIDAGDTLSLAVIARGSSPSQDMTGAVDTPTDDTASDETSSGLILTDEPSLEGGTGSIATGAILESSGMIDSPVISHDDET